MPYITQDGHQTYIEKALYELLKGRQLNISHFCNYGYKCFILNNGKDNLGKFYAKDDEGIFLGYSLFSKAYRFFNNITSIFEESSRIAFDETRPQALGGGGGISFVFDILEMNMEDLVKDDVAKVDPLKNEDIKDDEEESDKNNDK